MNPFPSGATGGDRSRQIQTCYCLPSFWCLFVLNPRQARLWLCYVYIYVWFWLLLSYVPRERATSDSVYSKSLCARHGWNWGRTISQSVYLKALPLIKQTNIDLFASTLWAMFCLFLDLSSTKRTWTHGSHGSDSKAAPVETLRNVLRCFDDQKWPKYCTCHMNWGVLPLIKIIPMTHQCPLKTASCYIT